MQKNNNILGFKNELQTATSETKGKVKLMEGSPPDKITGETKNDDHENIHKRGLNSDPSGDSSSNPLMKQAVQTFIRENILLK